MIRTNEVPNKVLLFTLLVAKQEIRITAPMITNITPKFFNKLFMCVFFLWFIRYWLQIKA